MCHRISPLLIEELRAALEERRKTGHARVPHREPDVVVPDVYPGRQLPLFVPDDAGELTASSFVWGFEGPPSGRQKLVYNTRIETALQHAREGRGMWAEPIELGRCLVPVHGFYEWWTRSPARRGTQVRFTYPGQRVFLLAGVCWGGSVSIVTTEPNPVMAPVHNRMPLVLAPGESSVWLGSDYAQLADRSRIPLLAVAEEPSEGSGA